MNWIKQGMGVPAVLEEAIFDADINEIVLADSHHGIHILQILEERWAVVVFQAEIIKT